MTFTPSVELPAHGPATPDRAPEAVTEAVRDVLTELAQQPVRGADGRYVAGTLAAGGTLERSEQFWAAVAPAKADIVSRVRGDQGLDADAPQTLAGLIDAYAEARLFRTAMFLRLVDLGGPITSKGKARALYTAYLSALDRETKLAQVIGLERKTKTVDLAKAFAEQGRSRG